MAIVQSVVAGECLSLEQLTKIENFTYAIGSVSDPQQGQQLRSDYTRGLMQCYPEETRFSLQVLQSAIYENNSEEAGKLFNEIYERDKTNEAIRTANFLWNKQREYFVDALRIATDGEPDLRNQEALEDIIATNEERMRTGDPDARILFSVIPVDLRPTSEFSAPQVMDRYPKNISRAATNIAELDETTTPAEAAEAVRLFWRNLSLQSLDTNTQYYMGGSSTLMFLDWPLEIEEISNVNFYGYGYYNPGNFAFNFATYISFANRQYGATDDYERLLDHTIKKFPLGRELELLLRSQNNPYNPYQYSFYSPGQTDEKSRWYEVIRVAYAHHPEDLRQRLQELTDKILNGVANEHEFMMWMHLTNESQTPPSLEVIANFKKWARGIDTPTQPQLLNVARFFAGLGEWEDAVEYYQLLVLNRADYNEFQGQMYFGSRSDQQLSVTLIIDDVIEWLPITESRTFIRNVLPVLKRYDDEEICQFMSEMFNLAVLGKVFQPEEIFSLARDIRTTTTLPDNHNTPLQPFEALPLIAGIAIQVDATQYDEAQNQIQELLSRENVNSSSDIGELSMDQFSPFGRPPPLYELDYLVREFSNTLGITVPFQVPSPMNQKFVSSAQLVFGLRDQFLDFDNGKWMDQLTAGLIELLDNDTVEQRVVAELLAVLYNEFYQREQFESSSALAAKLNGWLAQRLETLTKSDLVPFAYLATNVDFPLTPTLFSQMLSHDFFTTEQRVTLIQKLREAGRPEDVFLAIQLIPAETSGLSLLQELREVGVLANKEAYVADLDERIEALETALDGLQVRVL